MKFYEFLEEKFNNSNLKKIIILHKKRNKFITIYRNPII